MIVNKQFDTLFLDRDGVINHQIIDGYVTSIQEFEFINGVFSAINKLNNIFSRIIVVTNQQCIGKGIITHEEVKKIHEFMLINIKNNGGKIDAVYYCPHLVSDNCFCRKPLTGLFIKAKDEYPEIKFEKSFMVGDSISDIEAGEKLNLNTKKITKNYTLFDWANDFIVEI